MMNQPAAAIPIEKEIRRLEDIAIEYWWQGDEKRGDFYMKLAQELRDRKANGEDYHVEF